MIVKPAQAPAGPRPADGAAARAGGGKAKALRFRLSEWTQKTKLVRERCTKVSRSKGKTRCKRYERELGISPGVAQEGRNVVGLGKGGAAKALRPGLYRLRLRGVDLGSRHGKSSVKFEVRR